MTCPILTLLPTLRPEETWAGLLRMLQEECRDGDEVHVIRDPGGYWNVMAPHLPSNPRAPVLFFQDDTEPQKGFLDIARAAWLAHYPDGVGLLALNDANVCHGGAAYAMTSKMWLWIMFGYMHFPDFWHNYLDTLMADRSKDLGRYTYVPEAVCKHMHYSLGRSKEDAVYGEAFHFGKDDYAMKNAMDKEWREGGLEKAAERMRLASRPRKQMVMQAPVVPPPVPGPPSLPKAPEPIKAASGKLRPLVWPVIQSSGQSKQSRRK